MKRNRMALFLLAAAMLFQFSGCVLFDMSDLIPEERSEDSLPSDIAGGSEKTDLPQTPYVYNGSAGKLALYGYSCLGGAEKQVYAALCESIERYEEWGTGPFLCTKEEFERAVYAVFSDHPEYFFVDGQNVSYWTSSSGGKEYIDKYQLQYLMPKEEAEAYQQLIQTRSDEILAETKEFVSEYQVVQYLHDLIVTQTSYDEKAAKNLDTSYRRKGGFPVPEDCHSAFSILGFFTRDKMVCAGYAKAFEYLLSKAGIWCTYVTGNSHNEGHAWNIVRLGGDYYGFDLTWDDPIGEEGEESLSYAYFGVTTEEMLLDHTFDDFYPYPSCTAEPYNYYRYNGLYLDHYDADVFRKGLQAVVSEGRDNGSFRFSSAEVKEECRKRLFDEEEIFDILGSLPSEYRTLDRTQISVGFLEDQNIMTITLQYADS